MLSVFSHFGFRAIRSSLRSDATAAIGIVDREGLGRVRHLAAADLWIQQRVRRSEMAVSKLPGRDNLVDLGTKGLDSVTLSRHMATRGFVHRDSRAEFVPALKKGAGS